MCLSTQMELTTGRVDDMGLRAGGYHYATIGWIVRRMAGLQQIYLQLSTRTYEVNLTHH
jgi:hypothetical protein